MALDFSSIDPYLAILAAARDVPYASLLDSYDKAERNEAKLWAIKRIGTDWNDQDPRPLLKDSVNPHIVILRPSPHEGAWRAATGYVRTEEATIQTSAHNLYLIDENDAWPTGWLWCKAPER